MSVLRALALSSSLVVVLPASAGAQLPGDVRPPGTGDGTINVQDVLTTLRMGVGLEEPRPEADSAPMYALGPYGLAMPDGDVGVEDTLCTLRASVGLHEPRGLANATRPLDELVRDVIDTMRAVLEVGELQSGLCENAGGRRMAGEEPCPDGGSMRSGSGMMDSEDTVAVDYEDCQVGDWTMAGHSERTRTDAEGFEHYRLDLHLRHDEHGEMTVIGEHRIRGDVELEPGRWGSHSRGHVDVETESGGDWEGFFDLMHAEGDSHPVGDCQWLGLGGPAVDAELDGGSMAQVTVIQHDGVTRHDFDLDDGRLGPAR